MRTRGYIDGIFGAAVRGWVVDLDDPAHVLHVVVRLDGHEFAPVPADEVRADLAKAGIADDHGGFRVHIGVPPGSGSHEIVAVVAGTATAVPLAEDFRLVDDAGAQRSGVELYEGVDPAPAPPPPPPPPGDEEAPEATDAVDAGSPAPPPEPRPPGEPGLAGETGWVFRCPEDSFDLVRGIVAPPRAGLDRLAARVDAFGRAAAERGAICVVAVVPDKLHVYPEHVPATLALYPTGRVAEHLAAHVQDADGGLLLDLLPVLLRARAHGRVFSRAGTGPTWLGAFHAYRAVAKLLATAVPALQPRAAGAILLDGQAAVTDAPVEGPLLRWQGHALVPDGITTPVTATATEAALSPGFPRDVRGGAGAAPRAVIVHDRWSGRVAELLGDHCDATQIAATVADPDLLERHDASVAVWLVSDGTLARRCRAPE